MCLSSLIPGGVQLQQASPKPGSSIYPYVHPYVFEYDRGGQACHAVAVICSQVSLNHKSTYINIISTYLTILPEYLFGDLIRFNPLIFTLIQSCRQWTSATNN